MLFILIAFILNFFSHFPFFSNYDDEIEGEEFTLGSHVLALWKKRSKNLIHDYAVARWAFSVQPEIHSHCIYLLTGSQQLQIEQVVVKLHQKPCPNLNVINESIEDIVDIFWTEFKNFQTNRFPFDHPG